MPSPQPETNSDVEQGEALQNVRPASPHTGTASWLFGTVACPKTAHLTQSVRRSSRLAGIPPERALSPSGLTTGESTKSKPAKLPKTAVRPVVEILTRTARHAGCKGEARSKNITPAELKAVPSQAQDDYSTEPISSRTDTVTISSECVAQKHAESRSASPSVCDPNLT